ncbi:MAG TPA: hypothetical protein ENJ19_06020 [Gammaproteobacteria bacterium]|nr:hypothetical protein [Gammaproteobacteria bacterium]
MTNIRFGHTILKTGMATGLSLALAQAAGAGDFNLDFIQDTPPGSEPGAGSFGTATFMRCNVSGASDINCATGLAGYTPDTTTPFLMEIVESGGKSYNHVIIGDPTSGFAQDVYVRGDGAVTSNGAFTQNEGKIPLSPPQATANPKETAIRQILQDGEVTMEFLKDFLATKPKISATVTTPEISYTFDMDMRSINYDTDTTAAPLNSTLALTGASAPGTDGNFNSAAGVQASNITGGRYTYTNGGGSFGSGGSYSYFEGSYDTSAVNWGDFRDPLQNP